MSDYNRETWVDDDGSTTTGTMVTAGRMNNLEAGVRDAAQDSKQRGPMSARPAAATANKNWIWTGDNGEGSFYSDGTRWIPIAGRDLTAKPADAVMTSKVNIAAPGGLFDGFAPTVAGSGRILLVAQASGMTGSNSAAASANGVWDWWGPASAMTRAKDFDQPEEFVNGVKVRVGSGVGSGSVWGGSEWVYQGVSRPNIGLPPTIPASANALPWGLAESFTTWGDSSLRPASAGVALRGARWVGDKDEGAYLSDGYYKGPTSPGGATPGGAPAQWFPEAGGGRRLVAKFFLTVNVTINNPGALYPEGDAAYQAVAGDKILLVGQTGGKTNGLYVYNGPQVPMHRAPEMRTSADFRIGTEVFCQNGAYWGNKTFRYIGDYNNPRLEVDLISFQIVPGTLFYVGTSASLPTSVAAMKGAWAYVDTGSENTINVMFNDGASWAAIRRPDGWKLWSDGHVILGPGAGGLFGLSRGTLNAYGVVTQNQTAWFTFDPAESDTPAGRTCKWKIELIVLTNNTAPGTTVTVGCGIIYLASLSGSGVGITYNNSADPAAWGVTIGGSMAINSRYVSFGSEVGTPAILQGGNGVLACQLYIYMPVATAANSWLNVSARLFQRYV